MTDREDPQSWAWFMLVGRAQQYERVPSAYRGIKAEDIAGMLASLDERAYFAARLCKAGDERCRRRVTKDLYEAALVLSEAEEWNLPRGIGQLRRLVELAIIEATARSVPCPTCEGKVRAVDVAGKERACELCQGRGRLPLLQQTRADAISVNEANWTRTWRDRYHRVDEILQIWLSEASSCLSDGLAGRSRKGEKRRA
jgi:hypothetical protein